MSALFDHLSALHRAGHARGDIDLMRDFRRVAEQPLRAAAVLIGVTDRPGHPDGPGVLLIHRPAHMRAHPGQAAFPGGKADPGESAAAAALREAHEELGIAPDRVRVVGETDGLSTGSGFHITPVLAVLPGDLPITPNAAEVDSWFEPPFGFALDPRNQHQHEGQFAGQRGMFTEIHWQGHRIWGVTAAIIVNLTRRLAWPDGHG